MERGGAGGTGIGVLGVVAGGPLCWISAGTLGGAGTGTCARGSDGTGNATSIICGGGVGAGGGARTAACKLVTSSTFIDPVRMNSAMMGPMRAMLARKNPRLVP